MQKQDKTPIKTYIVFLLVFLLGAAIMAYPPFSAWYNDRNQQNNATSYIKYVQQAKEDFSGHLNDAREYNQLLRKSGAILTDPFDFEEFIKDFEKYEDMLNVTDVMATIEIPAINVNLPIYHGSEEETLKKGIGHLSTTSLPVGGMGSHCVLTGHTGLPGKTLFTDLVKLEHGDIFKINVLGETLTYQVDDIKVVLPTDISTLTLDQNEDYVTLITCTPYGVNDHRLLVRGTRIHPEEMSNDEVKEITNKATASKKFTTIEIVQLVGSGIAFILFIRFLIILIAVIKENRRDDDEEG